ncbi:hypothetical protein [Roseicella sp. DB1501]|uniref:hypothetical protein n=1 Tax=Roseicella sp. DB1501 TaxID=2730925 RepID=UPI001491D99E|nr:hypothetical protein [Roseicella sp. DB1501]NOG73581.1 hypothetical protein [Roseicella sp. DB1501]
MFQPAPESHAARLVRPHLAPADPVAALPDRRQAFDFRARPLMALDCRFEGGQRKAFKYPDLLSCEFDGGRRITLYFEMATVIIEGRNLVTGYDHLVECKVASVQERHCSEFELEDCGSFVERIRVGDPQPRGPAEHPAGRPGGQAITG